MRHHVPLLSIAAAALVAAALPASAQTDTAVVARLGARADSTLLAAVPRGFNGIVRLERNGAIVLYKAYGLANRELALPFTTATVVPLGTSTKNLTLVALLRLQAQGKLRLSDTLPKFFPDAPADKRRVTLQHLVNHTAGLPTRIGGDYDEISRDEFIRQVLATPIKWTPGATVNYSNAGYAVLAAVIEQVTGKPYDEQVRDDILAPLGLANTGLLLPNFDPARLAHGYMNGVDQGTMLTRPHAADGAGWNMRGSAGTLSTVDDMHAFYTALFTTTLLNATSKKKHFDPNAAAKYVGSDQATSFLYERAPKGTVEIIIASNAKDAATASTWSGTDALAIRSRLSEVIELLIRVGAEAVATDVASKAKASPKKSSSSRRKHRFRIRRHHHF